MATWLTHMRVSQMLLDRQFLLKPTPFLVGSIAPDCSRHCSGGDGFDPPKAMTHFMEPGYRINEGRFFDDYLEPACTDPGRLNFMLGYYTHLVVDRRWDEFIKKDDRNLALYVSSGKDSNAVASIKKEWENLDRKYLQKSNHSIFFTVFQHLQTVPDYLDFYQENSITLKIREIIRFYKEGLTSHKHQFFYLDVDSLTQFVDSSSDFLACHDSRFRSVLGRLANTPDDEDQAPDVWNGGSEVWLP